MNTVLNRASLRRVVAVAGAATIAIGAASGCGHSSASLNGEPGAAICPDTFAEQAAPPATTHASGGVLVAGAAQEALLCVFPFSTQDHKGVYRLGKSIPIVPTKLRDLVEYLNHLAPPPVDTGDALDDCSLMGHDQYDVVLGYPSSHITVRIDYSCGTVSTANDVRRLDHMDGLLAFWPNR
jgi:hypothetical protein